MYMYRQCDKAHHSATRSHDLLLLCVRTITTGYITHGMCLQFSSHHHPHLKIQVAFYTMHYMSIGLAHTARALMAR